MQSAGFNIHRDGRACYSHSGLEPPALGGGPVQWIEIDLGKEFNISRIEMTISQYPEGKTAHRLSGAGAIRQFSEWMVFDGFTSDGMALVFSPASPMTGIQFIRVETISSPSWVAWREIEVIDAGN